MLQSPIFWIIVVVVVAAFLWLRWKWRKFSEEYAIEQATNAAMALVFAGQGWQAEQQMQQLVQETSDKHGPRSRLAGQAWAARSVVLMAQQDFPRAVESLREACQIEPVDRQARKERLTHYMNLGELLSRMGDHAEAEQVLRTSLAERGEFYGKEHSGYAYGLESLGETVLRQGRVEEALAMAEESIAIDRASRNPHIAQGVALKAVALASRPSTGETCFPDWDGLNPEERSGVVQYLHVLAESFDAAVMVRVYRSLESCLQAAPSANPPDRFNATIAVTNMARKAGEHQARVAAFERMLTMMDEDVAKAEVLLGLALAQADAGQSAAADESYRQAVSLSSGTRKLSAQALRNYAVFLADEKRPQEADETHQRSLAASRESGDEEILGRALCAAGIFYHHQGRFADALPLLEESAQLMPQEHPDAICTQSHLASARLNQPCDCDQHTPQAIAEVVRNLVMQRAPAGLVKNVRIDFNDEQAPISVEAARKPTDEEGRQLYNAVQNALAELRRRQALVGYRN